MSIVKINGPVLLAALVLLLASCIEGDRAGDSSSVNWGDIQNKPAGLDDGDDDTTYQSGAGILIDPLNMNTISVDLLSDNITVNTGNGLVHWTQLENVPAGFADDVDDDTMYSAGTGIDIDLSNVISVYTNDLYPDFDARYVFKAGDTMSGDLMLDYAAPQLLLSESDQVLPAGLWRLAAEAGALSIQENTAVAGDFSTANTPLYMAGGGNVGIGTTMPGSRLHVAGTATATAPVVLFEADAGPGTGAEFISGFTSKIRSDSVDDDTLIAGDFTSQLRGTANAQALVGVRAQVRHNGSGTLDRSVGVGIEDLDNSGGGVITDTYGLWIGSLTDGTQTNTPYSIYADDPNAWTYLAGDVGIGTDTPGSTLDVAGDLTLQPLGPISPPLAAFGRLYFDGISNKLKLSEDGVTFVEVLTSSAGGAGITGGPGTTNTLPKFTGATTIGDSILSESSSGSAIRVTSKDAAVELLESDQILPAGLWRQIARAGNFYIEENLSGTGNFLPANTPLTIAAGGNVGISNVDPQAALDVAGKTVTTDLQVTGGGGPVSGYVLTSNVVGDATWQPVPGGPGPLWVRTGNSLLTDGVDNLLGTTDAGPLRLITAGATRLFVATTGEVGIGTTAPGSSMLDVAGTATVDSLVVDTGDITLPFGETISNPVDEMFAFSDGTETLLINLGMVGVAAVGTPGASGADNAFTMAVGAGDSEGGIAGDLWLGAGDTFAGGAAGNIFVEAGDATVAGGLSGSVSIRAGDVTGVDSDGGAVYLSGGNAGAGIGDTGYGGGISFYGGSANGVGKEGGNIILQPGVGAGGAADGGIGLFGNSFLQGFLLIDNPLPLLMLNDNDWAAPSPNGLFRILVNDNNLVIQRNTSTARDFATVDEVLAYNGVNVGIGTTSPAAKLDVRGDIKLGPTGQYDVPAGEEKLRILRGTIAISGSITAGTGFTVTHAAGSGVYTINFTTPFPSTPSVTVAAWNGTVIGFAKVSSITSTSVIVRTYEWLPSPPNPQVDIILSDMGVHFIVMGPR